MKASEACFSLIRRFEGLRLAAYLCPARVWTIGWGHTRGVVRGTWITRQQAEALLEQDVAAVELDLLKVLPAGLVLTQGQYDALVSLCFNLAGGAVALPRKAPHLWADLTGGKKPDAADEFLDMDHAGGVELAGLHERRIAERALFLS